MVPFLKGTLGTMLPMLGMAKQDNMRWVFSFGELDLLPVAMVYMYDENSENEI